MNRLCHRLVFSRRLGMTVAVAEHARGTTRSPGTGTRTGPYPDARPATRSSTNTSIRHGTAPHAPRGWRVLAGTVGLLALLPAAMPPALAQATAPAAASARPPVVFASKLPAPAFNLPQPVTALFRDPAGRGAASVVSGSGTIGGWSISADGRTATFDQGSAERVLLNWQSFDIAQGYTVRFLQDKDPAKYVAALNRVWGSSPSVIQGQLVADREVQLVNPNGVYFGATARVQTGKLVASALSVPDAVVARGIRNVTDASAVFTAAGTDHLPTDPNAAVTVEAGAEITTAAGGDVLLVAPRVVNQGRIATPDGQTVLAAGDKVYLMSSSDPKLRGLIVAVDAYTGADGRPDTSLGLAENSTAALAAQLNEIRAERGSVNLVGLTVRQAGLVNATTAVRGANGVVQLQAMASTVALEASGSAQAPARGLVIETGSRVRVGQQLGTVEFGAGSTTQVLPEASGATQLDAEAYNPSVVRAEGAGISVGAGARIVAPSGDIAFKAAGATPGDPLFDNESRGTGRADGSRIVVAPGAVISAAGLQDVAVDGARNQGALRLFRIELADAPVQRDGPLYRQQVLFDLRNASTITAANVTGAAASLQRTAEERAIGGGSITLQANGAVVVGEGALLDVSGGSTRIGEATIANSQVAVGGQVVSFSALPGGQRADALLEPTRSTVVPAYTEGGDGGTLLLSGRQVQLAGTARGSVVQGEYQRDQRSTPAAPATLQIGSGVADNYYLQGIALRAVPGARADAALLANPLAVDLSSLPTTAALSLAGVAEGGFGRLLLRAASVTQPEFGRLDLGARGSLDIAASDIALDGAYAAAGGRIAVVGESGRGGTVALSSATVLDAAGRWTNDTAAGSGVAAPVQTDGGSVVVRGALALAAGAGAQVDVSAGARLAAGGAVTRGKAGSVSLGVAINRQNLAPDLQIDGLRLRGLDFGSGGTLSLTAPTLVIGDRAEPGGVSLDAAFFSQGGFGRIDLTGGDVRVAAGTRLQPQLLNWQLDAGYRSAPSGAMDSSVAAPTLLDARLAERQPVNLRLAAARPLNSVFPGGTLSIERDVQLALEPGASLALQATLGIDIGVRGGTAGRTSRMAAPGGTISLALTGGRGGTLDNDLVGFLPEQALWLGNDAALDVSGTAVLRPDTATAARFEFAPAAQAATPLAERRVGRVLGGGTITLAASRGYVVAEAGSRLQLDGAAATLNLPGVAASVQVAQAAGTLSVSSPEGIVLDGAVSAQPPRDAAGQALADGGRLQVAVGAGGVDAADRSLPVYPTTPRELRVGSADGELLRRGTAWGGDLTATLGNGTGWVREALLTGAGFGAATLAAGDLLQFERSLSLSLPLGVQLNAPAVAGAPGTQVELRSAYAVLGEPDNRFKPPLPDTTSAPDTSPDRDTRLTLKAETIDVVGNIGLRGYSRVSLEAAQDLRLSAAAPRLEFIDTVSRRLAFEGELALTAGQVYATSGSQYTLLGGTDSRLVVRAAAGGLPVLPPLTAYGSITAFATDIDQGGVLRQPFGSISLQAQRTLTLGAGSLTSVSGSGASVLYGQTVNLTDWDQATKVSGAGVDIKRLALAGATIATDPSATVSAAGGGRVLAWEFFSGVGGTRDRYADAGLYAVLPDHATTGGLPIAGGLPSHADATRQFVVTMAGSGLAPGRYALLPARDALLGGTLPQGAFLVSRAASQGSTTLRAPLAADDGSVTITGYFTSAGSTTVGTPGERFVVQPLATAQARSDVRLANASDLLLQRAASLGQARPALPRDGGQVGIRAGEGRSAWSATLALGADGGQAGQLDIAATRLALLDRVDRTPADSFGIGAATLGASDAGSVLLGGLRTTNDDGTVHIDASATQRVGVDLRGGTLRGEELLLAAAGTVSVAPGSTLQGSGSGSLGPRTLRLAGDGALLAVGSNLLTLERTGASLAGGELVLGAGAQLSGRQVVLDATAALTLPASTRLAADALTLGAPRIVVGEAQAASDGTAETALTGSLLDGVRAADALVLKAYDRIDFAGTQDWSSHVGSRLELDAPLVRGVAALDGSSQRTTLVAQDVVLRNGSGLEAGTAVRGGGGLLLEARPPLRAGLTGGLTIGPGALALGFDGLTLRSSGDIVLQGTGSVTAQGDVALLAARVTAATGADQQIQAGGELRVDRPADARTLGERVGQGARLTLAARTAAIGGTVDLPGGRLSLQLQGTGGDAPTLSLRSGARLAATGFTLDDGAGFVTAGAAGSIDISAAQGRVSLAGTLDVSAATVGGDAGSLRIAAPGSGGGLVLADGAALRGRAGGGSGDQGGRLAVDVATMADASPLAAAASAGGFDAAWALRVREGDVLLDTGVRAARIDIAADGGRLALGTRGATLLDARGTDGGAVTLAAAGDLVLGAQARIDARGITAGGDVLLASSSGRVRLDAAASVDAGGATADDGRIVLRALRADDGRSVQVDRLDPSRLRAGDVAVEAVRVYEGIEQLTRDTDDDISVSQQRLRADNNAFIAQRGAVLAALGLSGADAAHDALRAGVELRSSGDMVLTDDWNLAAVSRGLALDRPGGQPGTLTLRAAGNLRLDASLSDGFTIDPRGTASVNAHPRSWSYRLVGGADLGAAHPLAVTDLSAGADDIGSVVLGPHTTVRTGAGSIAVAAGRDIVLSAGDDGSQAGLFAAGRSITGAAAPPSALFDGFPSNARPQFTEQGGGVRLTAARDIVSAGATQLFGNWLWRTAGVGNDGLYRDIAQLAWWTQFDRYTQGVGAFGGGSVLATAGRDIVNLQAVAPSSGYADARDAATATVRTLGGGTVVVDAGRDVLGGQFLLGRGTGRLQAGGQVGASASNVLLAEPMLALMDGQWRVVARDDVALSGVVHPTAAPAFRDDNRPGVSGYFFRWGADAGLAITSNAGQVKLPQAPSTDVVVGLGLDDEETAQAWAVLPPALSVTAATGNVQGRDALVLFPSASGGLRLWASDSLNDLRIAMADGSPSTWPSAQRPAGRPPNGFVGGATSLVTDTLNGTLPGTDLHAAGSEPARLHAERSILSTGDTNAPPTLLLPVPATVTAGEDIVELSLRTTHPQASDTTTITAGRNLLAQKSAGIEVVGPGTLDIGAGRGIDLGASAGVSTTGNQRNATLPAQGASIRLAAATTGTLNLDVLRSQWLAPPEQGGSARYQTWRALLLQTVRDALAAPALDYDAALAAFAGFPAQAQAAFGARLLAEEFSNVYARAPAATEDRMRAALRDGFDSRKAQLLKAGDAALAAGAALTLPGRDVLQGAALADYLAALRALSFDSLDTAETVRARVASLNAVRAAGQAAGDPGSAGFEQWRRDAVARELASSGTAASSFGRLALPLRLALFDQGFAAAELGGIGSFAPQPIWPAASTGLLAFSGSLDMTQSGVVTRRGGDIALLNPGGAINVGLKDAATGSNAPQGVLALGGGNVLGYAQGDFQVNTQRVFIVGQGDMTIWSSQGDIDSGRGANTAVAAPPLSPRRSVDGVVFEAQATTTGSGLGILPDVRGQRSGTIGLFPAFGEILALDAFIRAPALVLAAPVKGADNLVSGSISGTVAPVAAPALAVSAPPPAATEARTAETTAARTEAARRNRNSLLTVELLGIGPESNDAAERCPDGRPRRPEGGCTRP